MRKRCPVCGEPNCPAWEACLEEHDLDPDDEEEDELEYERRQRG